MADDGRARRREAERIIALLRPHGWWEHNPAAEEGFEVREGKAGDPYEIGGFYIDPWMRWEDAMPRFIEVLRASGYRVEPSEFYDTWILNVWPRPRRSRMETLANAVRRWVSRG